MIAAGWSDGSWAVAPSYCGYDDDRSGGGGVDWGTLVDEELGEELDDGGREAASVASLLSAKKGDLATGDTGGLGSALHFTYQVCASANDWVSIESGLIWREGTGRWEGCRLEN